MGKMPQVVNFILEVVSVIIKLRCTFFSSLWINESKQSKVGVQLLLPNWRGSVFVHWASNLFKIKVNTLFVAQLSVYKIITLTEFTYNLTFLLNQDLQSILTCMHCASRATVGSVIKWRSTWCVQQSKFCLSPNFVFFIG